MIPVRRCTDAYISDLVTSTLRSCRDVERKWQTRFDQPLFPALHVSAMDATLRTLAYTLLSPLSARHRIKRRMWAETRRLRRA